MRGEGQARNEGRRTASKEVKQSRSFNKMAKEKKRKEWKGNKKRS